MTHKSFEPIAKGVFVGVVSVFEIFLVVYISSAGVVLRRRPPMLRYLLAKVKAIVRILCVSWNGINLNLERNNTQLQMIQINVDGSLRNCFGMI